MIDPAQSAQHGRQQRTTLLLAALQGPAQILVLGPLTILVGNPGELRIGIREVAPFLAWPLLVAWLALVTIGLVLPARFGSLWRVFLTAVGVTLWLQGSFWVGEYGALDGQEIDWAARAGRTPGELAMWLGLPLAAVLLHRRLAPVAGAIAGSLLLVQALGLAVSARGTAATDAAAQGATTPITAPAGIFSFSSQQNGLLLVLDAFHSDAFAALLEDNETEARDLARQFDGFTFFREHTGAFPNTRPSLPAMFSGARYDNQEPWSQYLNRALGPGSMVSRFAEAGWEVDVATFVGSILRGPLTHRYRMPRPFASEEAVRFHEAMLLLDVSWFRHAPHVLKPWVFNDQAWRLQGLSKVSRNMHHASNGKDFLEHFTDRVSLGRDAPVFKIVHVGIPHKPVVLDGRCRWIGVQPAKRAAYTAQAHCAMRLVEALFERLRALGIYDDMLIVIAADHGTDFMPRSFEGTPPPYVDMPWLVGRAMPLLLVKPQGSTGRLRISDAPTTITDLPATIAAALDWDPTFPGVSVFELDPDQPRERRFDGYYWRQVTSRDESLPFIHRLGIRGPVRAAGSWHDLGSRYPLSRSLLASRIEVGDAKMREHLGWGWSWVQERDGIRSRWAVGDRATVHATLPSSAVRVRLRLLSPPFNHPQKVEVWVDGTLIGTSSPPVDRFVDIVADLPAGERPPISTVSLRFSRHQSYGKDLRSLAVQIQRIELEPVDS